MGNTRLMCVMVASAFFLLACTIIVRENEGMKLVVTEVTNTTFPLSYFLCLLLKWHPHCRLGTLGRRKLLERSWEEREDLSFLSLAIFSLLPQNPFLITPCQDSQLDEIISANLYPCCLLRNEFEAVDCNGYCCQRDRY